MASASDLGAVKATIASLENLVDIPASWTDQHFDLLKRLVEYQRPSPLNFSQDVDPRLAPKMLDAVIEQTESILRNELQALQVALDGTTRYIETVDGFYRVILAAASGDAQNYDVERLSRYTTSVHMLVSADMANFHEATLELLRLVKIDNREEFDVQEVISRIEQLKPQVHGRPELSVAFELFFRCADLRLSLDAHAGIIARFQETIPSLRQCAQRLRELGLLPDPPSADQS